LGRIKRCGSGGPGGGGEGGEGKRGTIEVSQRGTKVYFGNWKGKLHQTGDSRVVGEAMRPGGKHGKKEATTGIEGRV